MLETVSKKSLRDGVAAAAAPVLLLWAKWRLQFEDFKEERNTWLLLGEVRFLAEK